MSRVTASLPVPDSPSTRTFAPVAATRSINSATRCIAGELVTSLVILCALVAPHGQSNRRMIKDAGRIGKSNLGMAARPFIFPPSFCILYVDAPGIAPQAFQVIEPARRGAEDMDDEIAVIEQ